MVLPKQLVLFCTPCIIKYMFRSFLSKSNQTLSSTLDRLNFCCVSCCSLYCCPKIWNAISPLLMKWFWQCDLLLIHSWSENEIIPILSSTIVDLKYRLVERSSDQPACCCLNNFVKYSNVICKAVDSQQPLTKLKKHRKVYGLCFEPSHNFYASPIWIKSRLLFVQNWLYA